METQGEQSEAAARPPPWSVPGSSYSPAPQSLRRRPRRPGRRPRSVRRRPPSPAPSARAGRRRPGPSSTGRRRRTGRRRPRRARARARARSSVSAALAGLTGRHHVPLSRRRLERRRHESRHGCRVHHDGAARRDDRRRFQHHRFDRDAERHRRSEQPRDDLLLRVRHVDELRREDRDEERRVGDDCPVRGDSDLRPAHRDDVPLPHRRVERRRHERRQGLVVHHERRTDGGHGRRHVGDADLGHAQRERDAERSLDHAVVRIRHLDQLRGEDVARSAPARARTRARCPRA